LHELVTIKLPIGGSTVVTPSDTWTNCPPAGHAGIARWLPRWRGRALPGPDGSAHRGPRRGGVRRAPERVNDCETGGYNLEHNFGHGKKTLANLLVVLNLLVFSFHAVAHFSALAWRNAVAARGASYRFFEHLRTITAYIVFPTWDDLLAAIADPNARPP